MNKSVCCIALLLLLATERLIAAESEFGGTEVGAARLVVQEPSTQAMSDVPSRSDGVRGPQVNPVTNADRYKQIQASDLWPGTPFVAKLAQRHDRGLPVELELAIAEQQMTGYFLPASLRIRRDSGWSAYLDGSRRFYVYVTTDSDLELALLEARKDKASVLVRGTAFNLVGKALTDKAGVVVEVLGETVEP